MRGIALDDVLALCRLMVLDNGERWEPEPFQVDVIGALCRGVDRVWLEIPEGNGKSTFAAGLALCHLFFTADADAPLAAASRDQARVLLRQANGIVRRSDDLRDQFKVQDGYGRVLCPGTGGRMQVMAADGRTGDGVIPTLAILDELHRHANLDLMRTWGGKLLKRGGQLLIISTAGEPGGEYELAKAAALRACSQSGTLDRHGRHTIGRTDGFEIHVHALSPTDDIDDLALVKQANPLRAITVESLSQKRADPTWQRQHWARFTCGVPQREDSSAVSEQEWGRLPRGDIPAGETVRVGVDFGWKHDTTAITPFLLESTTRRVFGRPTIITPPRDGTSTKAATVREAFIAIHRRTPIEAVCMDPSAGGIQFAEWLEATPDLVEDPQTGELVPDYETGLGVEVIEVPQSNMVQAAAYAAWMEAVREGWIVHPHDEEFTRHVLNAIAKPISHDRYRFDRPNPGRHATFQDRRVIDALIAAAGVHWQAVAGLEPEPEAPALRYDADAMRITAL